MSGFKIVGPLVLKKNSFNVFAIYSHGGHLGHVTNTDFRSPFLKLIHMKFGFDEPSGFRGGDV